MTLNQGLPVCDSIHTRKVAALLAKKSVITDIGYTL